MGDPKSSSKLLVICGEINADLDSTTFEKQQLQ